MLSNKVPVCSKPELLMREVRKAKDMKDLGTLSDVHLKFLALKKSGCWIQQSRMSVTRLSFGLGCKAAQKQGLRQQQNISTICILHYYLDLHFLHERGFRRRS